MAEIRAARRDDLEVLYRVALATGDGGNDAAALYRDPRLLGHIYAAPYLIRCPETVFIAEDAEGIGGYIVGATDTISFETWLEREWWPPLRTAYPDPVAIPRALRTLDQRRMHMIHHPRRMPPALTTAYPAHLHINLLSRLRGRGIADALLRTWLQSVHQRGATGVHLAVGIDNARAIRFYRTHGFAEPDGVPPFGPRACWLVRDLRPQGGLAETGASEPRCTNS
jgi:ribosomal protein S18 acetylase RimI-like enzyme